MLGKPKFNYGDKVYFEIRMNKDAPLITLAGTVEIIDAYGTFEQNEEVSYDILVPEYGLFKHMRESCLMSVTLLNRCANCLCSHDYSDENKFYCEALSVWVHSEKVNCTKFKEKK